MRPIFIFSLLAIALLPVNAMAQISLNSISISTTSDGNISWNANVDGHNRRGYYDTNMLDDVCKHAKTDQDVLIPVTSELYPNPTTDMLFFTGTGYDNFSVTIKDLNGKVMATAQYFERASMDISSFDDGTYTIEIVAEKTGQVKTKRLIKE